MWFAIYLYIRNIPHWNAIKCVYKIVEWVNIKIINLKNKLFKTLDLKIKFRFIKTSRSKSEKSWEVCFLHHITKYNALIWHIFFTALLVISTFFNVYCTFNCYTASDVFLFHFSLVNKIILWYIQYIAVLLLFVQSQFADFNLIFKLNI